MNIFSFSSMGIISKTAVKKICISKRHLTNIELDQKDVENIIPSLARTDEE